MSEPELNLALVGTWVTEDEDSDTAFVVGVVDGAFRVSGFSRSDSIAFEIDDVSWDGEALSFVAKYPPTNTVTRNVFRARSDGRANLEITTSEVWIKRAVQPGELPAAWKENL